MNCFATCIGSPIPFGSALAQVVVQFLKVGMQEQVVKQFNGNKQLIVAEHAAISERQQALILRAAWMRRMGLDESEIETLCKDDGGPVDLQEELDNLSAAKELKQITPSYQDMKILVDRVAPSNISGRRT